MESRDIAALDRVGGHPALDFANTLGGALAGPWDDEWLESYADLLAWAEHAGLLAATSGLRAEAERVPAAAAAVHEEARALREAIYAAAAAIPAGRRPPPHALAAVAHAHRDALSHAELTPARGGGAQPARAAGVLDWTWPAEPDLRRPLWPLALAAVELLRDPEALGRLKQCRNCRWVFLDTSRNRSRRWCSMAHCGTEAKVRQLRARRAQNRRDRSGTE